MDQEFFGNLFIGLVLILAAAVYVAPSVVAFARSHPNRWIILLINVVFGGTVLGWGVALVWALHGVHRGDKNSGGESGLNLFIDDLKKVELVGQARFSGAAEEVARMHKLLKEGAISQAEFDAFKARLLAKS